MHYSTRSTLTHARCILAFLHPPPEYTAVVTHTSPYIYSCAEHAHQFHVYVPEICISTAMSVTIYYQLCRYFIIFQFLTKNNINIR